MIILRMASDMYILCCHLKFLWELISFLHFSELHYLNRPMYTSQVLFIYLGFYIPVNIVQVISGWVDLWAE